MRLSSCPGASALQQITPELRERLSGMPMTSMGAERLFALGSAHDVRAGASRNNTRAGVNTSLSGSII
eukprot:3263934-Pleurochrysis_carterae.AAC.1